MVLMIREQMERKRDSSEAVSLLISAEQSRELARAYLEYAGEKGSANWLIPIHASTEKHLSKNFGEESVRGAYGNRIHMEYLIMEQMV